MDHNTALRYVAKKTVEAMASAVAQEVVSRGFKTVLGKRKEKASQGEYLDERLQTAVYNIALAFERAAKLPPVTEVSQLHRWAKLKREYKDAVNLLSKLHKKRQDDQQQQETGQALVTRSSSPSPDHHGRRRRWVPIPAALLSFVSSVVGRLNSKDDESLCLSRETVERFERLAVTARDFLESVKCGCSLRRLMIFSGPLVGQLLEGKTLKFATAEGSRTQRLLDISAVHLQERGVEAMLYYEYMDHENTEKSFRLALMLRLSESTDIVQVAMKCLKSLGSQFNLVLAHAIGELTLLASSPDISAHPYAPTEAGIQEKHMELTPSYRSDPVCCSTSCLHEPFANDTSSSEFSKMFPEEVIMFSIECSISSTLLPGHRLLLPDSSSSDEADTSIVIRDRPQPLQLCFVFMPHFIPPISPSIPLPLAHLNSLVEGLQKEEGIAFDPLVEDHTKCSIRQMADKAIEGIFLWQKQRTLEKRSATTPLDGDSHLGRKLPPFYVRAWFSKHGAAFFWGEII